MLDQIIQAAILGILQGLTELLPISSSAHLVLVPWVLGWKHLGLAFDVVIEAGLLHAQAVGDILHGGVVIALFLEKAGGNLEELIFS